MNSKKNICIALLVWLSFSAAYCANYSGKVFVDANGNGLLDKGEKTVSGVLVSDGLNVAKTDRDGAYTLPGHAREKFIFITMPTGYYTHNAHYRKITPGETQYDFGIRPLNGRIQKNGTHSFIQITDTEIFNTENHEDWISGIRNYAANEQAAFIIHTGDICYENGLKAHIQLMNTENMNCPVFYTIGNHDLVKGAYGEELFESIYGPVYFSFDAGNVHYVVTPMLGGDYKPHYTKEDVYRWLKNDLANVPVGKPVVVFSHDLLTTADAFIYGINDTEFVDLNAHNLKAWIFGHWHINLMRKQGDVLAISTAPPDKGGIDHSTGNFRVMRVGAKGNLASELRYPYIHKSVVINSIADGETAYSPTGKIPLSVNAYFTDSPVKEISYSCLSDGKVLWKNKMARQTDWNWYAELPLTAQYEGKEITVNVEAFFNNGEKKQAAKTFIYRGKAPEKINPKTDWANLLGNPQHVGVAADSLHLPLLPAWITNVKANIYMASPLVYNGNVYVASVDENLRGEAHIYAINAATGAMQWIYNVRNSVKNSIAADGGLIFAQDAEGYLYAVDAQTGKLAWEKKLNVGGLPALIEGLVAANGIVYAGTGKGLCATEATTGKTIWENTGWGQGEGTTTTLSVAENVVIGGAQWRALYGNDASSGKLLWSKSKNGLSDRGASAAIHGNRFYIISGSSLFILDTFTGETIVRKELPTKVDVTSTPLVTDKEIIFGSSQSGLVALDKETLDMKWEFTTQPALIFTGPYTRHPSATIETSPVLSVKTVFFGASDGVLYGIDKESGECVWKHIAGSPVFGSVAVSGNALFAVDFGGNVYGFVSAPQQNEKETLLTD